MTPENSAGNEAGSPTADEFIALVTDEATFLAWNPKPIESLLTGEGRIRGVRVAIIAGESAGFQGPEGSAVADRIVAAIEQASMKGLPLLVCPWPRGIEEKEGEPAFLATVRIVAAIARHRAQRLPMIAYLRQGSAPALQPSWSSLAQFTFIEPSPSVTTTGPAGVDGPPGAAGHDGQASGVSENIDGALGTDGQVGMQQLPDTLERVLALLRGRRADEPTSHSESFAGVTPSRTDALSRARQRNRPGMMALLRHGASNAILLRGGPASSGRSALILALARFGEMSCIVLGQDRPVRSGEGGMDEASLGVLRRAMRLAQELALPLVTIIDSPTNGGPGVQGGQVQPDDTVLALAALVMIPSPRVSVLMGEGSGQAALALLPADRILAAENGWLSPTAQATGLGAPVLLDTGRIDWIVPEFPDAAWEPQAFCARIGWSIEHFLVELGAEDPAARLEARLQRFGSSSTA